MEDAKVLPAGAVWDYYCARQGVPVGEAWLADSQELRAHGARETKSEPRNPELDPMNPFLGVFFHWLGGLASGSFYVPYKGVKKWAWEVYWLVGGFFSWIICPWFWRRC